MAAKAVKGYSKFVIASKKICTLIAILIVAIIFAFPLLSPKRKQLELNLSPQQQQQTTEEEKNKSYILNPKFYGVNKDNEQYNVTASKAIEKELDKVFLEHPIANILLKDNKVVHLISEQGWWEQLKKTLLISGGVKLNYHDYNVNTDSAVLDIIANTITSNDKVQVEGPLGTLNANGFTIFNDVKKMVFNGQVKAVLYK